MFHNSFLITSEVDIFRQADVFITNRSLLQDVSKGILQKEGNELNRKMQNIRRNRESENGKHAGNCRQTLIV